jgi:hypothetical protein
MGEVLTMPDGSFFEIVRSPADRERDPSEIVFTARPGAAGPPVLGRVGPPLGLRPAPASAARAD